MFPAFHLATLRTSLRTSPQAGVAIHFSPWPTWILRRANHTLAAGRGGFSRQPAGWLRMTCVFFRGGTRGMVYKTGGKGSFDSLRSLKMTNRDLARCSIHRTNRSLTGRRGRRPLQETGTLSTKGCTWLPRRGSCRQRAALVTEGVPRFPGAPGDASLGSPRA